MEQRYPNYVEEDREFVILDLIKYVLSKWKLMIVLAIIGAIVLNCFGIWKSYQAVRAQNNQKILSPEEIKQEQLEKQEKEIADAKKELSQREIEEVDRAVSSYQSVLSRYNAALAYNENSIKMQLDPGNIPTVRLQYTIDNHFAVEYPVINARDSAPDIARAICAQITDNDVYQKIADAIGLEKRPSYIRELISTNCEGNNIIISIMILDEKDCEQVAGILEKSVTTVCKDFRNTFGEFDITLLKEEYSVEANADVLTAQTTQINSLNSLKSAMMNQTNGFNDGQKTYYNACLDALVGNDAAADIEDENVLEDSQQITQATVSYVHLKYIAVGIVCGIFFVACLFVVIYLNTPFVTKTDLEDYFGLRLLDCINNKTRESYASNTVAKIVPGLQKKNVNHVCIVSTLSDEGTNQVLQEMKTELAKHIKHVSASMNVLGNLSAMDSIAKADEVILVEKSMQSKVKNVKEIIEVCIDVDTVVAGCIMIEK